MTIRHDYVEAAVSAIRHDLRSLGLSENAAAKALGMSRSTLNAFMNGHYHKSHEKTLKALLGCKGWSFKTIRLLECLLSWDKLALSGTLPQLTELLGEDACSRPSDNIAAE